MVKIIETTKGDVTYKNIKLNHLGVGQKVTLEKIFPEGMTFRHPEYGVSYKVSVGYQDQLVDIFLRPNQYIDYLSMPEGLFHVTKDETIKDGVIVEDGVRKKGKRSYTTYKFESDSGELLTVNPEEVEGYKKPSKPVSQMSLEEARKLKTQKVEGQPEESQSVEEPVKTQPKFESTPGVKPSNPLKDVGDDQINAVISYIEMNPNVEMSKPITVGEVKTTFQDVVDESKRRKETVKF